ncbi:MAG TPA: SxtJ family membrane protein [Verrucomicrobiae bacterium]|jgi:hypothetical protein|nr:SxtJ family membrane protein [Verrucomicrobiae bacterium]
MKLRLKEDPKEWRKVTLLTVGGAAILSCVLRWRVLPNRPWLGILGFLAVVAALAVARPKTFRGFYRWSVRVGFGMAQAVGFVALSLIFIFVITPMGMVLRICGQDPLRLKRGQTESYWTTAKPNSPLDRMF